MNLLQKIGITSAIALSSLNLNGQDYLLNKEGYPNERGIYYYVKSMEDSTKSEFNHFFGVELDYVEFKVDDLEEYTNYNQGELGLYFEWGEIIIHKKEEYIGYSRKTVKKRIERSFSEANNFVRSIMIHELGHHFVNQTKHRLREEEKYDLIFVQFPTQKNFVEEFIEEGISEYCVRSMGEMISPKKSFIPKTEQELLDTSNVYKAKYQYAEYFVRPVLDKYGLEKGVEIILLNELPTLEEILKPELYYERLEE